jgi:hypothetical protein
LLSQKVNRKVFIFLILLKDMDKTMLNPGTTVLVNVRDWNNVTSTMFTLSGVIHSRVTSPAGYNVKLDKPHTFTGNTPLPFSDTLRVDMGDQYITLNVIFVRAFDIHYEPEYDMRFADKMRQFCDRLLFPTVSAVLPQENKLKISHILYYQPNGEIKTLADPNISTSPKRESKEPLNPSRVVVKYEHFFGFAMMSSQQPDYSLYFSSNRFAHINLLKGLAWGEIKPNPPKPKIGDVLCCTVSGTYNGSSESMDYWFIASPQLQLFAKLCTGEVTMSIHEAIKQLIIPENPQKLPILTEIPESRFLYAGIWLLMNKKFIPESYNLPKRKSMDSTDLDIFETWWPKDIINDVS